MAWLKRAGSRELVAQRPQQKLLDLSVCPPEASKAEQLFGQLPTHFV
jgi:hypothetical protein